MGHGVQATLPAESGLPPNDDLSSTVYVLQIATVTDGFKYAQFWPSLSGM